MQYSVARIAPHVRRGVYHNGLVLSLGLTGAPCQARRGLSSSLPRYNDLTNEKAKAAAVGPHMSRSFSCCSLRIETHIFEDDSSLVPVSGGDISHQNAGHHGDWVLFHPVYTPEELKAVEVSLCSD